MTDLKELLELASAPMTGGSPPVADDLDRGRKALRKRRAGMAGGVVAAAVLVTGAGGLAVARGSATPPNHVAPAAHTLVSPKPSPFTGSSGDSPFKLTYTPPGWKVQGWSPSAVVLVHTDGSPRTNVQDFDGKIAVLSTSTPIPRTGTIKTVGGKKFRVTQDPAHGNSPSSPVVASVSPNYDHAYVQVFGPNGTDPTELLKIAAGVTSTGGGTPAIG